jgi:hypothetical protein
VGPEGSLLSILLLLVLAILFHFCFPSESKYPLAEYAKSSVPRRAFSRAASATKLVRVLAAQGAENGFSHLSQGRKNQLHTSSVIPSPAMMRSTSE